MAEIAIMGGEPFEEWIKRNGNAQRLYKEYSNHWPDNTAECVAIGDEFYVRFNDGEMRHVEDMGDFDDESEWCAQCGTPIDPDGGEYYHCDVSGCAAVLCGYCGGGVYGGYYCPRHHGNELFAGGKEPEYAYPYAFGNGEQFTFGIEIEIESALSEDFVKNIADSDIIAGWGSDQSLETGGVELQTNILTMAQLPAVQKIVEDIPDCGENAGGHIHVARTPNQRASRWYWALRGLDVRQCMSLNMRHRGDDYWCELKHGEYSGKHTAVNDEHQDTIELRTFDCWYEGTAAKLVPVVKWIRAMWRFFEKHPRGTTTADAIERYASCMADNVVDTPRPTLEERLNAACRAAAARKAEEERTRKERAAEMRRHVEKNVKASRAAREGHGDTYLATLDWRQHENRRERGRRHIEERLNSPDFNYALPSRNLKPLHQYMRMVDMRLATGDSFRSLERFFIHHACNGDTIWNGFEYLIKHGDMADRVIDNIIRSRRARLSHGTPTREPLERTALRFYKRAGRPELCEHYARIRECIARDNA